MEYARLRMALILLLAVLAFGTFGYIYFEGMSPFDAFYMTLITISTVGFSEIKPLSPMGRTVTVVIILTGISTVTYTLGQMVRILIEGELRNLFGRKKVSKQIAGLRNHYIVCGYGRIGRTICQELASENIAFVVIEQNTGRVEALEKIGYLYLNLDATDEEALVKAGIAHAKGVVTAVRADANNVFITLTAKGLRPDIFVLSRASDEKNQDKLVRAGVSRVVCPYLIGGRRMAQVLKRPTVVDFIDETTAGSDLGLVMEEALVGPESGLTGKTIVESNIRRDYGVIVVAIKRPNNDMVFNPMPTEVLGHGDVIVVIGKNEDLERMKAVMG